MYVVCGIWHVVCDMLHDICGMQQVVCSMLHDICGMQYTSVCECKCEWGMSFCSQVRIRHQSCWLMLWHIHIYICHILHTTYIMQHTTYHIHHVTYLIHHRTYHIEHAICRIHHATQRIPHTIYIIQHTAYRIYHATAAFAFMHVFAFTFGPTLNHHCMITCFSNVFGIHIHIPHTWNLGFILAQNRQSRRGLLVSEHNIPNLIQAVILWVRSTSGYFGQLLIIYSVHCRYPS